MKIIFLDTESFTVTDTTLTNLQKLCLRLWQNNFYFVFVPHRQSAERTKKLLMLKSKFYPGKLRVPQAETKQDGIFQWLNSTPGIRRFAVIGKGEDYPNIQHMIAIEKPEISDGVAAKIYSFLSDENFLQSLYRFNFTYAHRVYGLPPFPLSANTFKEHIDSA